VIDALEHIHLRGIIHRDLKPENAFVTITVAGELQIILADFDQGKDVRETKLRGPSQSKLSEQELNSIRA
jgi:serine/threonine protein kinase